MNIVNLKDKTIDTGIGTVHFLITELSDQTGLTILFNSRLEADIIFNKVYNLDQDIQSLHHDILKQIKLTTELREFSTYRNILVKLERLMKQKQDAATYELAY